MRADGENERQKRWREALTWIYDRATAERVPARLSPAHALDVLERLMDEAHTELEAHAVRGLLDLLANRREAG